MGQNLTATVRRLSTGIWPVWRNTPVELACQCLADDTRATSAHHKLGGCEAAARCNGVAEKHRSHAQVAGNGG